MRILRAIRRRYVLFVVNHIYAGTKHFKRKRKLLNSIGHHIGKGTRVVGPVEMSGILTCGEDCWIGKNFKINGNGTVKIGNNVDVGPEVTFQTGGHLIGNPSRRAGEGLILHQEVGDGTWIGGGAYILNNAKIGKSCVVAGCACVNKDVEDNTLVGGVPARIIRRISN